MRNYPHFIKAYLEYTRASESPLDFHFWTAVSTIAGALRRRVWWDEHIFKWSPNFYIILVAPAGIISKSTSIDLGMKLLRQVEGIYFGPESMTWQALGDTLQDSMQYIQYTNGSGEKEYLLDEAKQKIPMAAVTIPISELGTFLDTQDKKAMSVLTRLWDTSTSPFQHKTKTQGKMDIQGPWLNIIGATTPAWIRNNIAENLVGEGLMSRIVFVYEERKRHLIARPSKIIRSDDFYEMERRLVEDLNTIASICGKYEIDKEADDWYELWYHKHNTERNVGLASDRYGGYLARKQGHLTKLAMVLAAAQRNDLVITKRDFEHADVILTNTERSMIRVFESIGVVDQSRHLAEIVAFVRAYNWLTAEDLYKRCYNIMSKEDFMKAVRAGVESGLLLKAERDGKTGLSAAQRTVN